MDYTKLKGLAKSPEARVMFAVALVAIVVQIGANTTATAPLFRKVF